jgi:hypothetical protein
VDDVLNVADVGLTLLAPRVLQLQPVRFDGDVAVIMGREARLDQVGAPQRRCAMCEPVSAVACGCARRWTTTRSSSNRPRRTAPVAPRSSR